jgi:hypothetical protein
MSLWSRAEAENSSTQEAQSEAGMDIGILVVSSNLQEWVSEHDGRVNSVVLRTFSLIHVAKINRDGSSK